MSEEQIERAVEWRMDALDRRLMRGDLSQDAYDFKVRALDRWASIMLANRVKGS